MHFTPLENFRRFVVSSPPLVIFTASLAIMAFGVLILACRLRNDPDYILKPDMSTARYCVPTASSTNSLSISSPKTMMHKSIADTGIVFVPIIVTFNAEFYYESMNNSAAGSKWIGILYYGQLGMRASNSSTVRMEITIDSFPSPPNCADALCETIIVQACSLATNVKEVHAADENKGDKTCLNSINRKPSNTANATLLRNRLDFPDHLSFSSSSSTPAIIDDQQHQEGDWCRNGSVITVQRSDAHGFVLIPILHDTLAARLHLLYTSYFLFTSILILILYAMCRRTTRAAANKHQNIINSNHHIGGNNSGNIRSQESGTTGYSKFTNDCE